MDDHDNGAPDWRVIADQHRHRPARISWPRRTGPTSKYLVGGVIAVLGIGLLAAGNDHKDAPGAPPAPRNAPYGELLDLYQSGQVRIGLYDEANPNWVMDPLKANPRQLTGFLEEKAALREPIIVKLSSPGQATRCEMVIDAYNLSVMLQKMKQLPKPGGRVDANAVANYCRTHANRRLGAVTLDQGFAPWVAQHAAQPASFTAQVDVSRAAKGEQAERG